MKREVSTSVENSTVKVKS